MKSNRFIRIDAKKLSIEGLRLILFNDDFVKFFCVYIDDGSIKRYNLKKPNNIEDFKLIVLEYLHETNNSVDSGNFNVFDCDYIDAYYKIPS